MEEQLSGGNVSASVVRVGDTVRKPWTAATAGVIDYLRFLAARGLDVPAPIGRDDAGRLTLEYVPGTLALHAPPLTLDELARVGGMVRSIHDVSQGYTPPSPVPWATAIAPSGAELICHNDLAPWNLIVSETRWRFIDWDAAGPSTRLWDLAYAAQAFTLGDPQQDQAAAAQRLAAFISGYGADAHLRRQLPQTMLDRATAMLELLSTSHATGRQPWARMYSDGHGQHWHAVVRYLQAHQHAWRAALDLPPAPRAASVTED